MSPSSDGIRLEFLSPRTWVVVLLLQAWLVGFAWMAIETGEDQEERVERVVAERHIEEHEERAERFLGIAALGLLLAGAGLIPGRAGSLSMGVTVAVAFAVLAAGLAVGHSGGALVYQHGAAGAYTSTGTAGGEGHAMLGGDHSP